MGNNLLTPARLTERKRYNDHAGVLVFMEGNNIYEHRGMARLYQEILQVFVKRDVPVLVGVSIRNGLLPASKAK